MFFKRIKQLKYTLVIVLSVGLSGCAEYLNGKAQEKEVYEVQGGQISCLKEVPDQLLAYVENRSSAGEIDQSIQCVQTSLEFFQKWTRGTQEDSYTSGELRSFFSKYFLKKNQVSPEFAAELMRFKAALVGGSDKILTKSEISRVVSLLENLKIEMKQLLPHVQILTMQSQKISYTKEASQNAIVTFENALIKMFDQTELLNSNYSFSDSKRLFALFSEFISGGEPFQIYNKVSGYVPLIENVKMILLGSRPEFKTREDWIHAIQNIMSLYQIVNRAYYEIDPSQILSSQQMNVILELFDLGLTMLTNSPQMLSRGEILYADIDKLLLLLNSKKLFPFTISTENIQKVYRIVIGRMLESNRFADFTGYDSLKRSHLRVLRQEYEVFRVHHDIFEEQLRKNYGWGDFSAALQRVNIEKYILERSYLDVSLQNSLRASWKDTLVTIGSEPTLLFDSQNRAILSADVKSIPVTWQLGFQVNLIRTLSRFLSLGYGNGTSLTLQRSWITSQSLSQWYEDFKSLGDELKAFDKRTLNAGERSFKEANYFTFSGDGDDRMSMRETFQFISLLFSGGMGSTGDLHRSMLKAQCNVRELDSFEFLKMQEDCFKKVFFADFEKLFQNLPGMVRYIRSLDQEKQEEFFSNLLSASQVPDQSQGLIELAEMRSMVMVLHYVESLFVTYDKNNNGILELTELEVASSRFLFFMRQLFPGHSDSRLRSGFYTLVIEGKMPTTFDVLLSAGVRWLGFRSEADRHNILLAILALKDKAL